MIHDADTCTGEQSSPNNGGKEVQRTPHKTKLIVSGNPIATPRGRTQLHTHACCNISWSEGKFLLNPNSEKCALLPTALRTAAVETAYS